VSIPRLELARIESELEEVTNQQSTLSEKEYNLHVERNKIIATVMAEEKPFEGTEWELMISNQGQVYLNYLDGNETLVKEVRDLCFRSWHDSFDLQEGIRLDFDDGKYSLHFNDARQLSIFAQKQSLKIVATDIEDKIRKLSKELSVLQTVAHQFNLKG
jgi:hypothetical protein